MNVRQSLIDMDRKKSGSNSLVQRIAVNHQWLYSAETSRKRAQVSNFSNCNSRQLHDKLMAIITVYIFSCCV
jgi:hypothetical protein